MLLCCTCQDTQYLVGGRGRVIVPTLCCNILRTLRNFNDESGTEDGNIVSC